MIDFWNDRYAKVAYAYGKLPNEFVAQQLGKISNPQSILFPAEGEGRNAVFAAGLGHQVLAFDAAAEAKNKALTLANSLQTKIDYQVSDVIDFNTHKKFDVIVCCYAHFPTKLKVKAYSHILSFLKPGGTFIFEAFSKKQLALNSGGPKNEGLLFSVEELKNDLKNLEFKQLEEVSITLNEGQYHQGKAAVIRCVGIKQ